MSAVEAFCDWRRVVRLFSLVENAADVCTCTHWVNIKGHDMKSSGHFSREFVERVAKTMRDKDQPRARLPREIEVYLCRKELTASQIREAFKKAYRAVREA